MVVKQLFFVCFLITGILGDDRNVAKYDSTTITYDGTSDADNTFTVTTDPGAVFQLVWMQGKNVLNDDSGITVYGSSVQSYNNNLSESWFNCAANTKNCPGLDSVYSKTQSIFSFTNKVTIGYTVDSGKTKYPFKLMLVAVDVPFCSSQINAIVEAKILVNTQYQSYESATCGYLIKAIELDAVPIFWLTGNTDALSSGAESMILYYGSSPQSSKYQKLYAGDNTVYQGNNENLYLEYVRTNASIGSTITFYVEARYEYWYPSFAWIWFILFCLLFCCLIIGCLGVFVFPSKKKRETTQQAAQRESSQTGQAMHFSNLNYGDNMDTVSIDTPSLGGPPTYSQAADPAPQPTRSAADELDSDQLGQLKQ